MKSKKNPNEWVNDAWLGLGDTADIKRQNPLFGRTKDERENLGRLEMKLMRDPNYLSFAAKTLLDVDVIPIQAAILEEIWNRPFPMFLGSRGFGKLIHSDELIRVKHGWKQIQDIKIGDSVYGGDGKLTTVIHKTDKQVDVNMYKITLRDGRSIECCEDHMWKVWDKNKNKNKYKDTIVWSELTTKEMFKKYFTVRKNSKSKIPNKLTKEYRYALPINKPLIEEEEKNYWIHPYVLGVLLGDGSITTKSISITTLDLELIDRVNKYLPSGYIAKQNKSCKKTFSIVRTNKNLPAFHTLLTIVGIDGCSSHTKFIPHEYKYGSYEQRLELIRGLMDTDGYSKKSVIEYYTVSYQLAKDFTNVARSCGLHCKKIVRQSWLNNKRYADCYRVSIYTKEKIFSIPRKLTYTEHAISKQGASKYEKVFITNIEYVGKGEGYCISVDNEDHTYITKDYIVTHNSFLLALYTMLRCALYPESKVVIIGAAFRQSKIIFEYMETIWRKAPILRSVCDYNSGPKHDTDRYTMRINDSWACAIPIGDGCLSPYTQTTYDDSFGYIDRYSDNTTQINKHNIRLWDGSKFVNSDENYYNGIKKTKKIRTKKGFSISGTENHRIKICRKNGIQWCRLDEMQSGDKILIDRSYRWHSGDLSYNKDEAYTLGAMIGDGCWLNKYTLLFSTLDNDILNRVNTGIGHNFKYSDYAHYRLHGLDIRKDWMSKWELKSAKTKDKELPKNILKADRASMSACLQGLMDTDGTIQVSADKRGGISIGVGFTNTSKKLVEQIQYILLHYGIVSYVTSRNRNEKWNTIYELLITGKDVETFAKEINFWLPRKRSLLMTALAQKPRINSIGDTIPCVKEDMLWILKHHQATGFREINYSRLNQRKGDPTLSFSAKFLLKYKRLHNDRMDRIRQLCDPNIYYDEIVSVEDDGEQPTYDLHVPDTHTYIANGFVSHNSKIRGLRAHTILSDEFDSIPPDIYETVVQGFTAVSADPIANVKEAAKRKAMNKLGIWTADAENKYSSKKGNQAIISGTAGYDFKHFAAYWKRYKGIIQSKGDTKKLKELFGVNELPQHFNWKDYSVIRVPYELIPEGFMDDKQVSRAKATVHSSIYNMEYGTCFAADSDGFFKRSLIDKCVTSDNNPVILPSGPIVFDAKLKGSSNYQYVFGIDPASERDNFSIVILELHADHTRIVYSWSTNRKDFKRRVQSGLVDKYDFYGFCARKIRELMKSFPTENIALDAQGGGVSVEEALHDPDKMVEGEIPLWPVIDSDKPKDTDILPGKHILYLCQFAKADWTAEANHGLRKDFEDKVLLFPRFDALSLALSAEEDEKRQQAFNKNNQSGKYNIYDTLEDCVMELEELKDELCTITLTRTGTGVNARDRWDTPEVKLQGGKKGRMRKDRYSALVMANMIARNIHRARPAPAYEVIGGFTKTMKKNRSGKMYNGPEWFTKGMNSDVVFGISKKGY